MTDLEIGTPEWRTHVKRSLAQRKRRGDASPEFIDYVASKMGLKKEANGASSQGTRTDRKPKRAVGTGVSGSGSQKLSNRHANKSASGGKRKTKTPPPPLSKVLHERLYKKGR